MALKIYNKEGILKLTVPPSENSTRQHEVMSDHVLSLSFSSEKCLTIRVNDYVDFAGFRFWAIEELVPKQISTVEWEYSCRFFGPESLIKQALMLKLADGENDPVFTLTAPAREHVALVVANINRQMDTTTWKVGEVIVTENLTIDYKGTYCNEALSKIAEAAKTEWWFEDMSVNVCRCERGSEVLLGYGNGLLGLERETADNVKFFTRLFPIGSTRNIDPQSYGHSRLQLPGGATYVERNIEQGIVEHYEEEAFSGIYPRRTGTVSEVRSEEKTGDNGKPFTIYYFKDSGLDFDPNEYEIGGLVKQVTFRSGELAEREFGVNYDTKNQEFEIITQWPYDNDMQIPGGLLIPKVGDTYILWNIRMPESYSRLAEVEYEEAVDAYMAEHDKDRFVYKAATDYIDIAERRLTLDIGQRVRLESEKFFPQTGYRASRITSISQSVLYPTSIDIRMSDVLAKSRLDKIDDDLGAVKHDIQTAKATLPDIIKSWEEIPANDSSLYSAKKSEREFLNKRRGGVVEGDTRFARNIALGGNLLTDDFVPGGFAGAGAGLVTYANGQTGVEVDHIVARRTVSINEVIINQASHVGGRTLYSAANMECVRVVSGGSYWRCHFDTKNGQRANLWKIGDQAYCQRYSPNGTQLLSYYWRLVTSVGEDWINLSATDCDGTSIPAEGDNIIQVGSRTDPKRQAMLEIDQTNGGRVVQYAGINSFNFVNRNEVAFGVNDQGKPFFYAYGDMFIGDRDLSDPDATYITFQAPEGETRRRMVVSADLRIGRGSTGLTNLSEWADKQQQIDLAGETASDAQSTANGAQSTANEAVQANQAVNDYVQALESDVNAELVAVNKRLDGVIENHFELYDPALDNYPANEWATDKLKEDHNGDTFTNKTTGNSWKWKIIGGAWRWDEITDTFEKELLNKIAKAQATADGKIRNFVFEPYPPYAVGDTWSQGAGGDMMRCIRSRESGVFDPSDWDKASKYTDDTAVDNLQFGGVNLIPGSSNFELHSGNEQYMFYPFTLDEQVEGGDKLTLHIGDAELISGDSTEYSAMIYNFNVTAALNVLNLPYGNNTWSFTIPQGSAKQSARLLLYAGVAGATAGNIVKFTNVTLSRGNKPMLSWAPSASETCKPRSTRHNQRPRRQTPQ